MVPPYQQLEQEYADFVGSRHAVSCSSGTAALHLALRALEIDRGDQVIVPDFAMAACAFAVSYCGAKPVFVDVDRRYGLDPLLLEKAITPRTKAIMVVHTYGRLADVDSIIRIARKKHIPVIEDACEAHGAVYRSKADITVYSFYRNKIIHAEEGGMATTDKKHLADRMNYLKCMAFSPAHDYFHAEIGYNYRMADCQARLALKSLHAYEKNNKKRRDIEGWYAHDLQTHMPPRDAVWFYEILVPPTARQEILRNVPAARHSFKPLSSLPPYGSHRLRGISAALSEGLLLLPAWPHLTRKDVREIAKAVNEHGPYIGTLL